MLVCGEVVLRGGLGVCLKCASSLFGASLKIRGVFVSLFNFVNFSFNFLIQRRLPRF